MDLGVGMVGMNLPDALPGSGGDLLHLGDGQVGGDGGDIDRRGG